MTNLIKIESGRLIVSSRDIAENFEKRHDHILRDLDEIKNGVTQKWGDLFHETTYIHEQNKQEYREVLMNRDGFTLLAMGFTGSKALQWKLKYIEAFNKMEQVLNSPKKLSPMEQLKLQYEVLDEHGERIAYLENNMTVDYGQQQKLQNKAKSKVVTVLDGINSLAYRDKSIRSKVFGSIWRDFKDYFAVGSYKDTSRVEFEKAIGYLEDWQVQGKLLREIEDCNYQMSL